MHTGAVGTFPHTNCRCLRLVDVVLGFFLIWTTVSFSSWSDNTIVTTLLSIQQKILKFFASLIQYNELSCVSRTIFNSFGGHPMCAFAVPTQATPVPLPLSSSSDTWSNCPYRQRIFCIAMWESPHQLQNGSYHLPPLLIISNSFGWQNWIAEASLGTAYCPKLVAWVFLLVLSMRYNAS